MTENIQRKINSGITTNKKKVSAIVSCFNGQKYLPAFLDNCAAQTISARTEIILVHNNPSENEINIIHQFQEKHPGLINHIIVPREPLAVSTNRAIKVAAGEYVCIWNVDDLRTEDSLELMERTLDENPNNAFTYGDYIIVNQWQKTQGRKIITPEFEKLKCIQEMHLGPFYMWRKSLCATVGYWDEQFKSGGDFDYATRLAVESEGLKTRGLLGYYLDEGLGLSTGKTPWQPIERTVIELRFGVYHKLDFWYYNRAKKYRIVEILLDGKWFPLQNFVPHYRDFISNKINILWAVVKYPFWILQRIFSKLKRHLNE